MKNNFNSLVVPIMPNRPLKSLSDNEIFGEILLRKNLVNGLIENESFNSNIVSYDTDYHGNQSLSLTFKNHMSDVLKILKQNCPEGSKFVEIGCGKGDFLELIQKDKTFKIYGYDKSYNGNNKAIQKRFLIPSDKIDADLVILRHVIEHIQKPHEFLKFLYDIFGAVDIFIEAPEVNWIISNNAFFNITYEYVNYFSQKSLAEFFLTFKKQGLFFGKQYQYIFANLKELKYSEYSVSYNSNKWLKINFYDLFPNLINVFDQINILTKKNSLYVWGGGTKGVLFCHHLKQLNPALFEKVVAVIDISKMKQNKFLPSTHLSIISEEKFFSLQNGNEYIIIMNKIYENEILSEFKKRNIKIQGHICV